MDRLWGSSVKKQENEALDRTICLCPHTRMSMTDTIRDKLTAVFAPLELDIVDDSAAHEGHSGHSHGGETHFAVRMVAPAFTGVSRVERQRQVYGALADELRTQIHALQLTTLAPGEG
jgi:BolA family transcriptional regulator, general stress-responsive regulator